MSGSTQTIGESVKQYTDAWNLEGIENIKSALLSCWTNQSTYVDPQNGPLAGIESLVELIHGSYATLPGRKLSLTSVPDVHNNSGRFSWALTFPDGFVSEGIDYFEFDADNKITKIVGFFEPEKSDV